MERLKGIFYHEVRARLRKSCAVAEKGGKERFGFARLLRWLLGSLESNCCSGVFQTAGQVILCFRL